MPKEEHAPTVRKLTLEERAATQEARDLLRSLTERAAAIEQRLMSAYGPVPTHAQLSEAAHQVSGLLIDLARDARGLALQYRGFNVGAAVIGLRRTEKVTDNPWVVLFDANTKPTAADMKWCAEQYLMDRATSPAEALESILAFVVVADPQTDDDSKRKQITLTPCKLCRDRMVRMLSEGAQIVTNDTEILTVHARSSGLRKIQKVPDLLNFHSESLEVD